MHSVMEVALLYTEPAQPSPGAIAVVALHSIKKMIQLRAKHKQVETANRCLMRNSIEGGTVSC